MSSTEETLLIAILTKLVEEKSSQLAGPSGPRGPRGPTGDAGLDGKDFNFAEHEETIRGWAKEYALKFKDLTDEQIEELRGPKGLQGDNGKDFNFDEHKNHIVDIVSGFIRSISGDLKLRFSDLNESDVEQLRGPRGRDGKDGRFIFDDHSEAIDKIIREAVEGIKDDIKFRFSDFSDIELESLRGPRGSDGRDGRDFNFDDHRDFFESLRLKFSDLTAEERNSLKLRFSQLTEDEKHSLKLKFQDLSDEDKALLKGVRGPRGQRGSAGEKGERGLQGLRGMPGVIGLTGPRGLEGRPGIDGIDGLAGQDAPYIVAIDIEQNKNEIVFVFEFSDGTIIKTDPVDLPQQVTAFAASRGGGMKRNFETRIDEASSTVTYIGKAHIDADSSEAIWQIKKLYSSGTETIIEWAGGNDKFDKVWDDRAGLSYA